MVPTSTMTGGPFNSVRFEQKALTVIAVVAILYFGRDVLIPIALATLVSFLLAPSVVRLQRWGLGKTISVTLVVVLFFSLVILFCWEGFGQASRLIEDLPSYRNNITAKLRVVAPHSLSRLSETQHLLGEIGGAIVGQRPHLVSSPSAQKPLPVEVRQPDPSPLEILEKSIGSVVGPVATAFVVLIFVIFMLHSREDLRDRLLRLAGSNRLFMTTQALDDAARRVSRYLLMQFCVNVVFGLLVGLGLLLIGVPHPLVWSVLATLLRFIPYIGPWIAAAGPLLLSIGATSGWGKFAWTFGLYGTLELVTGNLVEPFLYGASTGISAIAILVAAVFWTWLWGSVGLLLSTPLTVCVVAIGRYVPHLEFLGILFGDEPALSPAQRFYQRMIARDAEDAGDLVEQILKDHSLIDCCDRVFIPAVSLVEEGRHAGFLDSATETYFLENTRELIEEIGSREVTDAKGVKVHAKVLCVPAKDSADELVCHMFAQILHGGSVEVLSVNSGLEQLSQTILELRPDIVFVSGVPPHSRHVAVACRHLRRRHPEITIMAAVWSTADLNAIRARIPVSDATHVVCTMQQAFEYVSNVVGAANKLESVESSNESESRDQPVMAFEMSISSTPLQEILDKMVCDLANAMQAPIALLSVQGEGRKAWRSQCGVPADLAPGVESVKHEADALIVASNALTGLVANDIGLDSRFTQSSLLAEQGIRLCAVEPIVNARQRAVGFLIILDTRTRSLTPQEEKILRAASSAVMEQIEIRSVAATSAIQTKSELAAAPVASLPTAD